MFRNNLNRFGYLVLLLSKAFKQPVSSANAGLIVVPLRSRDESKHRNDGPLHSAQLALNKIYI